MSDSNLYWQAIDRQYESAMSRIGKSNDQDDPFVNIGRVHDWRNHVPDFIRYVWDELTDRERKLVVYAACEQADQEEWE